MAHQAFASADDYPNGISNLIVNLEKTQKSLRKGIDKGKEMWYNNRAVAKAVATVIEN